MDITNYPPEGPPAPRPITITEIIGFLTLAVLSLCMARRVAGILRIAFAALALSLLTRPIVMGLDVMGG